MRAMKGILARSARTKWAVAATAVAAAVLAMGLFVPPALASAGGTVIASPCLNLRSDASGSASLLSCIPYQTRLSIDCVKAGTSVSGPYGTENIWDHTSWNGHTGFVSDAWVYTGSNSAVAPACSTASVSREQRAINWLHSHAGSTAYNGLCELMVERAYGTSGRYSSAFADYNAQRQAGRIHTDHNAPAGALVFTRGIYASLGHVMISNGDGRYWSSDGTVRLISIGSWSGGYAYYGWSYAPTSWPGA